MSPEVVDLVSRRWAEYGFPTDPSAGNGALRHSSGRLVQG
jgi:hypothetical protein